MRTREILERIEIRSLGQRDLRLGASAVLSRAIEMMAGQIEWWMKGGGDDAESTAAAVVAEAEPKIRRKLDAAIKDLRSLAREIKVVDPSLSAIDIRPGLVRAEAADVNYARLDRSLSEIERAVRTARYSLDKYKVDPARFAPQAQNFVTAANAIGSAARVLLRASAGMQEEAAPAFGWWRPAELQQALTDAYLKVHSLKADFDRMEEVPSYLKRAYDTMLKAASAVSSAQDVAQKLYNEMRHAQRSVR